MDGEWPGVGSAGHVLLFPRLGVAGKQDARRAVAEEDRNRVVVGLAEELAGRRGDDVRDRTLQTSVARLVRIVCSSRMGLALRLPTASKFRDADAPTT
jgi:hypothetical protein